MLERRCLSVWHVLGFVLLMLSLAATILLFCVRHILLDESVYNAIPETDGFVEGMTAYVLEDLNNECDVYDNGDKLFEKLEAVVTKDRVEALSRRYAESVYDSLITGEEPEKIAVDSAVYRSAIDAFFATLPAEERPDEESASLTMAKELADSTAAVLQSGLVDKVLPQAHRYIYGNATVQRLSSLFGWAVAATVVLTALNLMWFGSDFRRRAYATAGALFLGSSLVFVPFCLIQQHGIADRLVLGHSPLKLYVDGVVNGLIDGMTAVALWVFIVCGVLLLAAIAALVWPPRDNQQAAPEEAAVTQ